MLELHILSIVGIIRRFDLCHALVRNDSDAASRILVRARNQHCESFRGAFLQYHSFVQVQHQHACCNQVVVIAYQVSLCQSVSQLGICLIILSVFIQVAGRNQLACFVESIHIVFQVSGSNITLHFKSTILVLQHNLFDFNSAIRIIGQREHGACIVVGQNQRQVLHLVASHQLIQTSDEHLCILALPIIFALSRSQIKRHHLGRTHTFAGTSRSIVPIKAFHQSRSRSVRHTVFALINVVGQQIVCRSPSFRFSGTIVYQKCAESIRAFPGPVTHASCSLFIPSKARISAIAFQCNGKGIQQRAICQVHIAAVLDKFVSGTCCEKSRQYHSRKNVFCSHCFNYN